MNMGFGAYLERKAKEYKEQRAINKRMSTAVKRVEEEERFKARIAATKSRVRREEAAKARGGGGIGFMNPLDALVGTGGFSPGGSSSPRKSTARKSGTTITVNGTRITVHGRTKKRKRQKQSSPGFFL